MRDRFTICVLLYGDNVSLAARSLNSICRGAPAALPAGLRVAMNEPGKATEQFVDSLIAHGWLLPRNVYKSHQNIHKYPMMRRMLYDSGNPIATPYVMWFDDDSFIKAEMVGAKPGFLPSVQAALEQPGSGKSQCPSLCGSVYTVKINGNQRRWIEDQTWYTGVPVSNSVRFITGGWWVTRLSMLHEFDYPFPALDHRGGDVMLGALCAQQGLLLRQFRNGVAINADAAGRESGAARRGFNQSPVGHDYRRDPRPAAGEKQVVAAQEKRMKLYRYLDL